MNKDLLRKKLAKQREASPISRVKAELERLHEKAIELYPNYEIEKYSIEFGLKGRTAGMCHTRKQFDHVTIEKLRFNYDILHNPKHTDEFISRTVPHEYAHALQYGLFQARGSYAQQHGKGWRKIMQELGVKDVKRCHSYDTTPARGGTLYPYQCGGCSKTYLFTQTRHNKVKRGNQYGCGICKGSLKFVQ